MPSRCHLFEIARCATRRPCEGSVADATAHPAVSGTGVRTWPRAGRRGFRRCPRRVRPAPGRSTRRSRVFRVHRHRRGLRETEQHRHTGHPHHSRPPDGLAPPPKAPRTRLKTAPRAQPSHRVATGVWVRAPTFRQAPNPAGPCPGRREDHRPAATTSALPQNSCATITTTSARERPRSARLVPGTRPAGVYTTGELQQAVHLSAQSIGERAVVVGAEDVSYAAASTVRAAGSVIVAMLTDLPSCSRVTSGPTTSSPDGAARPWTPARAAREGAHVAGAVLETLAGAARSHGVPCRPTRPCAGSPRTASPRPTVCRTSCARRPR